MRSTCCLLCGAQNAQVWAEDGLDASLHKRYVRCSHCGLVYADPQAESEELIRYYGSEYYSRSDVSHLSTPAYMRFLRRRLATVQRFKQNGNLLEIGCGEGGTLLYFRAAGFAVVGIEPGKPVHQGPPSCNDVDILHALYPNPTLEDRRFDIIYCWHVIEHIPDPVSFLTCVRRNLTPDGILVLGTENIGWTCRMRRLKASCRRQPPPLCTSPEHTFFPARKTLSNMMSNAGFRVLRYRIYDDDVKGRPFSFAKAFHGSRQYLLNPACVSRWFVSASCYWFCNLINAGGSKCEVVATPCLSAGRGAQKA